MSLAALGQRLDDIASGARSASASEAARGALEGPARAAAGGHVRTGRLAAETRVESDGAGGLTLVGPEYLRFVPDVAEAFRDATPAAVEAYGRELLGGGS